jgi:hypothetical protein
MPNIFPLQANPPYILFFIYLKKISILLFMHSFIVEVWFFFPVSVYEFWHRIKKRIHRTVNFSQKTRYGFMHQKRIFFRGFLVCMRESGDWIFKLNNTILLKTFPIPSTFQFHIYTSSRQIQMGQFMGTIKNMMVCLLTAC